MSIFSRRSLLARRCFVGLLPTALFAADKPKDHQHRLGDLQSGLDGAQGEGPAREGIRQGRHRRSAGCRRSAPTRRWNSSTPARSTSARPPAPRRWSARSTAIRSSRSMSIRSPNGPRWSRARIRPITKIADLKGKRVAVTRGTDPHIFLVRALHECRPDREGHHAGAAAASGRQDRAHSRRRRCLGRARSDDGAGRDRGRRAAVLSQQGRPTPGASSTCARNS